MKQSSNHWMQPIEAGPFMAGLKAHGGATARGENGNLQIALSPKAMRVPSGSTAPIAWLLPLADIDMVRLSANVPGRLLWISPRSPRAVAGALVGDFQGAWWNGTEACLKLDEKVESYLLPSGSAFIGLPETLALIVALRWSGLSPAQTSVALRFDLHPETGYVSATNPSNPQLAVA